MKLFYEIDSMGSMWYLLLQICPAILKIAPWNGMKTTRKIVLEWGWVTMGQRITGQSSPDWLEMTSSRSRSLKAAA